MKTHLPFLSTIWLKSKNVLVRNKKIMNEIYTLFLNYGPFPWT